MHSLSLALCFAAFSVATPVTQMEPIRLWNGVGTVNASIEAYEDLTSSQSGVYQERTLLGVQTDCKGSAFCERLTSCDDAKRKIDEGLTYGTSPPATNSGVCAGTCGVFFSGVDCKGSGAELAAAYDEIRRINCKQCGRFQRQSDACWIKIDRVTGC